MPTLIPMTVPVPAAMMATAVLLLLHVQPAVASNTTVEPPVHMEVGPVIGATGHEEGVQRYSMPSAGVVGIAVPKAGDARMVGDPEGSARVLQSDTLSFEMPMVALIPETVVGP